MTEPEWFVAATDVRDARALSGRARYSGGRFGPNKIRWVAIAAASVLLAGITNGANNHPQSLHDALAQSSVVIESATGTGGSSGMVIHGVLGNRTEVAQRILVHFKAPLFFRNRGVAQNMAATQVYGRDGSYWLQDDGKPFVEVGAGARLRVTFVAYCADFEKDNPGALDSFDVAPLPQRIAIVMRQISAYESAHPDAETTRASQLALWVAQGHALAAIAERFGFDRNDEAMMRAILASVVD